MSGPALPIADGLFELDATGAPTLLGGRCADCDRHHFPTATSCPWCRSIAVSTVALSRTATAWGWTTVHTAPPGYDGPVPFGFGVVELPEGLRIVTRITETVPDALTHGDPMVLVTASCGTDEDGVERVTWAFSRAEATP